MDEIKTAPKVSVAVPAYNCEGFLPETLDCLLAQSLKDIQIIIVDDGSTDGTPAMADRFAAQDKRVTAIHKENGTFPPPATKASSLPRANISSSSTATIC